jgi:hypothetical protein
MDVAHDRDLDSDLRSKIPARKNIAQMKKKTSRYKHATWAIMREPLIVNLVSKNYKQMNR